MAIDIGRNDPCPCGSGRRYKHCHGSVATAASPSAGAGGPERMPQWTHQRTHREALAAHRAGALSRAEALYRQALAEHPDDSESMHMLGVLEFERMHDHEALGLLVDANDRVGWADPVFRQNLGLVLAKLVGPRADARQQELVARYLERERLRKAAPAMVGCVSVVVLAEGSSSEIASALDSIATQTFANIEIVVAMREGTGAGFAPAAWRGASPAIIVEANGHAQSANLGAARASGRWVTFIEAGDRYAPDRIERMVAEIARAEPQWGFSRIGAARELEAARGLAAAHDAATHASRDAGPRPGDHRGDEPASFALLHHDLVRCIGNLFVQRELFVGLGGFRDVDDFAWEFARRASRVVEPVSVAARLYFRGDPSAAREAGAGAADARVADALQGDSAATNSFCPQLPANRDLLLRSELRAGRGDRIPVDVLRSTAVEWRSRRPPTSPRSGRTAANAPIAATAATAASDARVALVVLGVYRSGTSAIARALNLCGAALPERLIAPRLAINPKGFWEAEAISDLDARLLHQLGADWNSVDVALPDEGALVDEFLERTRELLAREYGDATLILIKDPRISMLAPLWDRALRGAGYRPAYLVALRHPLEVARSFAGQGDMPVESGLALWHAYMRRIESFTAGVDARVAWLRYTTLLDDWRRALRGAASRLDVALDLDSRAGEVDAFLEPGMRNHRAGNGKSGEDCPTVVLRDVAVADTLRNEIDTLYRQLVARCYEDAGQRLPE